MSSKSTVSLPGCVGIALFAVAIMMRIKIVITDAKIQKVLEFLVETPTFFANSLRFAGKSDALAELYGRCTLHTAEETGEIRPSILSFCVLKFHAALAGCAKLEGGLAAVILLEVHSTSARFDVG